MGCYFYPQYRVTQVSLGPHEKLTSENRTCGLGDQLDPKNAGAAHRGTVSYIKQLHSACAGGPDPVQNF
jgi:hypothetical protein